MAVMMLKYGNQVLAEDTCGRQIQKVVWVSESNKGGIEEDRFTIKSRDWARLRTAPLSPGTKVGHR